MVPLLLVAISVGLSNFAASIGLGAGGADRRTWIQVGVIFGLFEGGMPAVGLLVGRSLATTLGATAHWVGASLLVATGGYAILQAVVARRRRQAAPPTAPAAARDPSGAQAPSAVPACATCPDTAPVPAPAPGPALDPDPATAPIPNPAAAATAAAPAAARTRRSTGRLLVTGLALSMDNLVVGFAVGTFHVGLLTAVLVIAAVSVALSLVGLELGRQLGTRLGGQTGNRGEAIGGLVLIGVGVAVAAGAP